MFKLSKFWMSNAFSVIWTLYLTLDCFSFPLTGY